MSVKRLRKAATSACIDAGSSVRRTRAIMDARSAMSSTTAPQRTSSFVPIRTPSSSPLGKPMADANTLPARSRWAVAVPPPNAEASSAARASGSNTRQGRNTAISSASKRVGERYRRCDHLGRVRLSVHKPIVQGDGEGSGLADIEVRGETREHDRIDPLRQGVVGDTRPAVGPADSCRCSSS